MSRPVRLVVCVNRRLGSGLRSCVGSGSLDLIGKIERLIADENLEVPIVRRECLSRYETGPVMRIAPAGAFSTEIDEARQDDIVVALKSFIASRHANPS